MASVSFLLKACDYMQSIVTEFETHVPQLSVKKSHAPTQYLSANERLPRAPSGSSDIWKEKLCINRQSSSNTDG